MSDTTMTGQAPQGGSDRPPRRPRWLVPTIAAGAVALLVAGIALVIPAVASARADEVQDAVAEATCVDREITGDLWDRLPAELRKDVREVVLADPEDRPDLWQQIRDDAVDGEYGPRASRIASRLAEWADDRPEALTADIEQVRLAGCDERRVLAEDVIDGALAGKYGPDVQQRAEWLQEIAERRGFDRTTVSQEG